jgi:hypothetical protein
MVRGEWRDAKVRVGKSEEGECERRSLEEKLPDVACRCGVEETVQGFDGESEREGLGKRRLAFRLLYSVLREARLK